MLDARMQILIRVAERMFHLEPGDLTRLDRSEPLVSYRKLVMLVAVEAGISYTDIGVNLDRDRTTVKSDIERARYALRSNRPWWTGTKADLFDAWQDALEKAVLDA